MNKKRKKFLHKYGVPIVLLLTVLIIQLLNPHHKLLSYANISLILIQSTILAIISLALALIMISGETDMSIQGIIGLLSITFSMALSNGKHPMVSLLMAILLGVAFGLGQGLLITKMGLSSFIITITVMFIAMGAEKMYNAGNTIWLEHEGVKAIGTSYAAGLPVLAWIAIICYVIGYLLVNNTKFGFQLRITGENEQAAKEVGIRTWKLKIITFIIAGVLYGIASAIEPIRTGGTMLYSGKYYLLPAMAACYLGSTMFVPGRVNIIGTFIGAVFMSVISNFMTFLGATYFVVPLVEGAILLATVMFANIYHR